MLFTYMFVAFAVEVLTGVCVLPRLCEQGGVFAVICTASREGSTSLGDHVWNTVNLVTTHTVTLAVAYAEAYVTYMQGPARH